MSRLVVALMLGALVIPVVSNAQTPDETAARPEGTIDFRYEILGNPVVGQPVAVNLFVTSAVPVTLDYRIVDTSSMTFPESQALQVAVTPPPAGGESRQQITVVPQREGRLFLNVSGTVDAEDGAQIRAASIPIQVSAAPEGARGDAAEPSADESEPDAAPETS